MISFSTQLLLVSPVVHCWWSPRTMNCFRLFPRTQYHNGTPACAHVFARSCALHIGIFRIGQYWRAFSSSFWENGDEWWTAATSRAPAEVHLSACWKRFQTKATVREFVERSWANHIISTCVLPHKRNSSSQHTLNKLLHPQSIVKQMRLSNKTLQSRPQIHRRIGTALFESAKLQTVLQLMGSRWNVAPRDSWRVPPCELSLVVPERRRLFRVAGKYYKNSMAHKTTAYSGTAAKLFPKSVARIVYLKTRPAIETNDWAVQAPSFFACPH